MLAMPTQETRFLLQLAADCSIKPSSAGTKSKAQRGLPPLHSVRLAEVPGLSAIAKPARRELQASTV